MNPDTELQQACDEVLKKIGRNLLMFQKVEHLIKHLMTLGSLKMTHDEPTNFEEQGSIWQKRTLGGLMTRFAEKHLGDKDPLADFPTGSEKAMMAFSFSLGQTDAEAEARKAAFAAMVTERNDLVHHLFLKLDRTSLESCREIDADLDDQRKKVLPHLEWLQERGREVISGLSDMLDVLGTQEGMKILLSPEAGGGPTIK